MRHIDEAMAALRRAAWLKLAYAALLAGCAVAAALPRASVERGDARTFEWPTHWDGRALRPLAPGNDVERRFAARFPGAIARLDDGERQFVMRHVAEPTRMLHPAADCYRASGYRIEATRIERDAEQRDWRCFDALRGATRMRVCERITDRDGRAFSDSSAWFWSALLGRSRGPWLAVTTAQALP